MATFQRRQAFWSESFENEESVKEKYSYLYEIGFLHYHKNKWENALENFEKCRDICLNETFGEQSDEEADTYHQLGWCYQYLNR